MKPDRRSPRFLAYINPAMRRPQLWRLLVGVVLCVVVYFAFVACVFAALWWLMGDGNVRNWATPIVTGRTPTGTLVLLYTFLGMALGPIIAARLLHKRTAATLFGRGAVVIRDFTVAAVTVAAIILLSSTVWIWNFDGVPNVEITLWLRLLPLAILGLLIQTGAEELLFRGYLQQQLAARFRSPVLWMILPALLFGAVHYDPVTAGSNAWIVMGAAAIFGLAAADLTAVTGSIGAAWGFHFVNNFAALLILSLQGTLSGLSLYITPYGPGDQTILPGLILADLVVLVLTWALIRRIVRR